MRVTSWCSPSVPAQPPRGNCNVGAEGGTAGQANAVSGNIIVGVANTAGDAEHADSNQHANAGPDHTPTPVPANTAPTPKPTPTAKHR